jgi:hypothetical protein
MIPYQLSASIAELGEIWIIGSDNGLVHLHCTVDDTIELDIRKTRCCRIGTLENEQLDPVLGKLKGPTSAVAISVACCRDNSYIRD